MCGRARLPADWSEIKIKLGVGDLFPAPNLEPSWNLAPTQDMVCIVRDEATAQRKSLKMRWGLIPKWAKEPKMDYPTFNAKGETVHEKATFRAPWKAGQRCLVVTDGFYEWRKSDKQPFAIACVKDNLTVMAGLWERWTGPTGESVLSCCVITTQANELIGPIHDRMPVILAEGDWPAWLGEVPTTEERLRGLLRPYPADQMELWPVNKRVGNVRNNDASLVDPIVLT